ncbi:glycosyltransferase family 8 protein [Citrobacter koseri]|uniref:glycosyltransferase family 8 protein n=1 Tax=Citrobacter TaxID=544 RepID=UPI000E14BC2B|nr:MULTISPECIES: glycosyltransferase [Citrobacter]MBJ8671934.1 glycosyltransferase family 8 protein [Citrobacter koseri]MBJ8765029.1 glycosyltransferase family 8 protein [Citrobacter koseri]MBJ9231055.1 glycosyltransferase family 8 protein [Citrobacter koseri]MDM3001854.1 glycosyltransferase family 8 protein [Citrobacter sp. CK188]QYG82785.1 glycosyltransferase family 8 protein [Citrobacter koseri]
MDNKTNVINIAYCTDANYLEYVAVSIMSVIMNNPEQSLAFFVFVYDVSDEDIAKLQSTSNKIQVITIDKADIEKYNNDFAIKHLNRSTYMRLAVPRLLKDKVERFIYLDADTLCFDSLSEINSVDIDDVVCAVSHDSLNIHDNKHARRLGLSIDHYFNAGFLYINVANWIKHDIEHKANTVLFEQGKSLPYFDQDALNIAMNGNITFIDNRWNFLFNWFTDEQKENFFYHSDTLPRIIHFTGGRKPWYKEHTGLSQQLYVFYHHFTPWRNAELRSYAPRMRPTDYRVYSRQAAKKGNYFTAIKWYAKYLKTKIH